MYQRNCYNYDWFVNWLKRNLNAPQGTNYNTEASHVAKNFSRLYFDVSEQDAAEALKSLGFEYKQNGNSLVFSLDRSSPAFTEFWKSYE